MWFFLGSIELSSNVKPVWVGLKIKGAEITQFSTPLLNCHTCPKKHIQRFENTLFLPPPMAIVDRLKKKHIPPPKHTHTHNGKKQKQKTTTPLLGSGGHFPQLGGLPFGHLLKIVVVLGSLCCFKCLVGIFSGENLSISWSVLLNFRWLPRQYELIWLGFWYVLCEVCNLSYNQKWRCFGFFLISFKPSTKTWTLHLSQFCCLPKDLQTPGGHPNSAKSSWFRGGILEVLVKNVLNAWNLFVYGWFETETHDFWKDYYPP